MANYHTAESEHGVGCSFSTVTWGPSYTSFFSFHPENDIFLPSYFCPVVDKMEQAAAEIFKTFTT